MGSPYSQLSERQRDRVERFVDRMLVRGTGRSRIIAVLCERDFDVGASAAERLVDERIRLHYGLDEGEVVTEVPAGGSQGLATARLERLWAAVASSGVEGDADDGEAVIDPELVDLGLKILTELNKVWGVTKAPRKAEDEDWEVPQFESLVKRGVERGAQMPTEGDDGPQ